MKIRILLIFIGLLLMGLAVYYLRNKTITVIILDDQTKRPLPHAGLTLYPARDSTKLLRQQPGEFEFSLTLLPWNVVTFLATASGYQAEAIPLNIPLWERHHTVQFNLKPNRLTGQVLDAVTKKPLAKVSVSVGSVATTDRRTTMTDAQGKFEFYLVRPQDMVSVEPPTGYKTPQKTAIRQQHELTILLLPSK